MSRMKNKMMPPMKKKAEGGKVPADERTDAMVKREMEGHKRGGKVAGCAPKARLDKRARGGRMTPKEPYSGAGNMSKSSYMGTNDRIDDGGKGPTVRP